MSKLQLDISDFEHVKSDKDKTTLRSKKFKHTVTIAHNSVHPDTRKIFERLSELGEEPKKKAQGGSVNKMYTTNNINGSKPEPGYTDKDVDRFMKDNSSLMDDLGPKKMAQGGHPDMEDIKRGGAPASPADAGLPCLNPHCKSHGKPHPNCRCYSGGEFAKGGKVKSYCETKQPHKPGCMYAQGGMTSDDMGSEQTPMEAAQISPETKEKATGMAMGMVGGPSKIAATPETLAPEIRDTAAKLTESLNKNGLGHQVTRTLAAKLKGLHNSFADAMQIQGFDEGGEVQHNSPGDMSCRQPFEDGGAVEEITPKQGIKFDESAPMKGTIHSILDWAKNNYVGQGPRQVGLTDNTPPQGPPNAPQPSAQGPMSQSPATPPSAAPDVSQGQGSSPDDGQPPAPDQQAPSAATDGFDPNSYNQPAYSPQQTAAQAHQQALQIDPQAQLAADERTKLGHNLLLWEQDLVDGHVAPKTYKELFDSKSTTGKIGTMIGLLVAGAGAGLTHQPNAVLQMMDNEINRDFEAQKKSKDNAHNYVKLMQQSPLIQSQTNLNNVQKSEMAMQLGKAHGYAAIMHDLLMTRNKFAEGSDQYNNMNQQIQQLYPMYIQKASNLVDGAAALSAFGNGAAGQSEDTRLDSQIKGLIASRDPDQMKQARILQAARIPGVGKTRDNSPVPPDKKDLITGMNTLDYKAKDLMNFIDQHKGLNPSRWSPAVRREGEAKLGEMRNFYNNSIQGGALTALKDATYDNLFGKGAPTDIWPQLMGSRASLKEVADSNLARRDIQLKNLNIPIPKGQSYLPENMQNTQQNQPVKGRDGRMYVKDPSGKFMVPVK